MRLERLLLKAFGPFTDVELDLSGGSPGGLHVVYGPNEAGKSTSLRAVTSLLYGIPHRTGDAHLHPNTKLSVGAVVSSGAESHELVRLKRRKSDLVDFEGNPIAEDPLPRLLGSIDELSFRTRFGLDQDELERGAEALLGGSEQGLFAAGTAGAEARSVLEGLKSESEGLFLPRGKVPRLNRALSEHDESARDAKKAERPPEKWLEQKRAYDEANAELERLTSKRKQVRSELRHLNRVLTLLSDLHERRETLRRLAELGPQPELPANASERREENQSLLTEVRVEGRRIQEELLSFEAEVADLPLESPLAEVDEDQFSLATRVGTARSARKDLPKRQTSLLDLRRQIGRLLAEMTWKFEEGSELSAARRALEVAATKGTIRRLAAEKGALQKAVEEAHRIEGKLLSDQERHARQEFEGRLGKDDLGSLEAGLASAQSVRGVRSTLREEEDRLSLIDADIAALRARTGTRLSWKELLAALPSRDQAVQFGERNRRHRSEKERLLVQREEHARRKAELERRLTAAGAAELPTEGKLTAARSGRDEVLGRAEVEKTPERFAALRAAVQVADSLSDRLRFEADRVAAAESLEREKKNLAEQFESVVKAEESLAEGELLLEKEMVDLREALGVQVGFGPEEVDRLSLSLRELAEKEKQATALRETIARRRAEVRECAERLVRVLGLPPENCELDGLISVAEKKVRGAHLIEEQASRHTEDGEELLVNVREAQIRRRKSEDRSSAWAEEWRQSLAPFGLAGDTSVERAEEVLSAVEKIARAVDEATALERRILGMTRDTEELSRDVVGIAKGHAPAMLSILEGMDEVDAAAHVLEGIKIARRGREERIRLRELIATRRQNLSEVEARREGAEGQLRILLDAAGVESIEELPLAEERAREAHRLTARLEGLESGIRDKSDGSPLVELEEDARPWQGESRKLRERVEELEESNNGLDDELRVARSRAEGMLLGLDTYRSEDVVIARQNASQASAVALTTLREYLVVKAAQTMLATQMERYAQKFAGPIASRAGEIFERLTLGRYQGLQIGVGENVLRCRRDGASLEVRELSRGTRAQLYFALRLSSLEAYFEDQPAIPLVFDDLFVDFDDDRTTAAFEVLGDVAKRVQVLYFTHLARDVEAADNAVPRDVLFQHSMQLA